MSITEVGVVSAQANAQSAFSFRIPVQSDTQPDPSLCIQQFTVSRQLPTNVAGATASVTFYVANNFLFAAGKLFNDQRAITGLCNNANLGIFLTPSIPLLPGLPPPPPPPVPIPPSPKPDKPPTNATPDDTGIFPTGGGVTNPNTPNIQAQFGGPVPVQLRVMDWLSAGTFGFCPVREVDTFLQANYSHSINNAPPLCEFNLSFSGVGTTNLLGPASTPVTFTVSFSIQSVCSSAPPCPGVLSSCCNTPDNRPCAFSNGAIIPFDYSLTRSVSLHCTNGSVQTLTPVPISGVTNLSTDAACDLVDRTNRVLGNVEVNRPATGTSCNTLLQTRQRVTGCRVLMAPTGDMEVTFADTILTDPSLGSPLNVDPLFGVMVLTIRRFLGLFKLGIVLVQGQPNQTGFESIGQTTGSATPTASNAMPQMVQSQFADITQYVDQNLLTVDTGPNPVFISGQNTSIGLSVIGNIIYVPDSVPSCLQSVCNKVPQRLGATLHIEVFNGVFGNSFTSGIIDTSFAANIQGWGPCQSVGAIMNSADSSSSVNPQNTGGLLL